MRGRVMIIDDNNRRRHAMAARLSPRYATQEASSRDASHLYDFKTPDVVLISTGSQVHPIDAQTAFRGAIVCVYGDARALGRYDNPHEIFYGDPKSNRKDPTLIVRQLLGETSKEIARNFRVRRNGSLA